MSEVPTPDAQRVIADVLRKHEFSRTVEERYPSRTVDYCCCGWRSTFEHRTHPEHQAAAVVAALGGLTREAADVPESYETGRELPNPFVNGPDMIPERRLRFVPSTRWVGGWIPKEAE